MHFLGAMAYLLLDVRAHIPNTPNLGAGPVESSSYGTPLFRGIAAFFVTTVLLLWLAVRLAMGLL
jgi:hypothetical protein